MIDVRDFLSMVEVDVVVVVFVVGGPGKLEGGGGVCVRVRLSPELSVSVEGFQHGLLSAGWSRVSCHDRPDTLRAKFGLDIVRNGIHCTDLVEDGPLESDFMFVAMAEGV